jgi:hypothetical protein
MDRTDGQKNDLRDIAADLGPRIEEAKERLREVNERAIAFIKERPVTCIVGALAVGYLIGRVLRR